jgi:hypothetical protein
MAIAIAYAQLLSASGKTPDAEKTLLHAAEEARKAGLLDQQFEIKLALGETEIKRAKERPAKRGSAR